MWGRLLFSWVWRNFVASKRKTHLRVHYWGEEGRKAKAAKFESSLQIVNRYQCNLRTSEDFLKLSTSRYNLFLRPWTENLLEMSDARLTLTRDWLQQGLCRLSYMHHKTGSSVNIRRLFASLLMSPICGDPNKKQKNETKPLTKKIFFFSGQDSQGLHCRLISNQRYTTLDLKHLINNILTR